MNTQQGIRKAAILVDALDRATADLVLEQMGAKQAELVRRAMIELGRIDAAEQQRVVEEFFRIRPMVPRQHPPGIELDGRLANRLSQAHTRGPRDETSDREPPLGFLRQAEGESLARILRTERPQTIALVLAHLPPEKAGNVLVLLPEETQVEVVRRLIDLEETDPDILREVERGLRARLSAQVPMERRRVAGLAAVGGIIRASGREVAGRILGNLARVDHQLAEKFAPAPVEFRFDDLARLDADSLAAIVQTADAELVTLALVGAPDSIVHRVLRQVPQHQALSIRHELDNPGPIRLSDVEEARRRLARLAGELNMAGRVELPEGSQPVLESVTA